MIAWQTAPHGRLTADTELGMMEARTTGRGPRCAWRARIAITDGPHHGAAAVGSTPDDAARARADRDDAIRDAITAGVPIRDVTRRARITADTAWRIARPCDTEETHS